MSAELTGESAIDPEILEIFVEEVEEVVEDIDAQLPVWQQDPDNKDAALEIKRAFHTIKGGGRMVGAEVPAELAWSIENLLDKIENGSVEYSAVVYEAVSRARALMPELMKHYAGEGSADLAMVALVQNAAEGLARNEAVSFESAAPAEEVEAVAELVSEIEPETSEIEITLPEPELI